MEQGLRLSTADGGGAGGSLGIQVSSRAIKDAQTPFRLDAQLQEAAMDLPPPRTQHLLMDKVGTLIEAGVGVSLLWWVRVVAKGVAGSGNQGVQQSAKLIICYNCGKPGHTRKDCHEKTTRLGLIHSDAEVYSELLRKGRIRGRPCKCMIDTGANRTTVLAKLIQTHE